MQPLAPERFGLQLTISGATRDKLERAKALMRHRNPSGDLAVVIDAALGALIAKHEKETFAVTDRPRVAKPRPEDADPTYASPEVRRAVYERDEDRCTFRSPDGSAMHRERLPGDRPLDAGVPQGPADLREPPAPLPRA